ncbi:MAG: flagellar export chaperone FlgN [Acidimicrobiales bacterium]
MNSTVGYEDLSSHLWRQRAILEMLVFKLEEEHLLLASGRHGWLAHSTSEVNHVLEALNDSETARAGVVADLADELGMDGELTLSRLASTAPEPWGTILAGHRHALVEGLRKAQQIAALDRELLGRDLLAASDALTALGESSTTYESDGTSVSGSGGIRLLDRAL